MKLYLKGDYGSKIPYDYLEFANKMWFKEKNGIPLEFSHSWDEDIHLSVRLNKWGTNDERWESISLKTNNPWDSLKYESISLEIEQAYESDGREKGDCLRILSTHVDILTVDKRAMYIMAIEVATAINGQISEDDKETWLTVEEFKARHQELLSLTYEQATDMSLEEIQTMKATYEPLQEELDRRRDEYIKLHGERVYEYDDDEDEAAEEGNIDDDNGDTEKC